MLVRSLVPATTVLRRSVDNFRDTAQIVAKRLVTRPAHYPQILWLVWAVAWLLLTIAVLIRFDDAAGMSWGRWPIGVIDLTDFFTVFGLGGWYLVPSVLVLLAANLTDWRSLPRRSLMLVYNWTCFAFLMLSAAGLSGLTVNLLKYGIGRARPVYFNNFGDLSLYPFAMDARFASFPSGHATNMGAVFAIVLLLFPERKYVALAFALWVASTRIFVGAHYPSDTVAGFGLGCAIAVACALVFARLGFIFRRTTVGLPVRKRTFRLLGPSRKPDRSSAAQHADFGLEATR